MMKNWTKLLLTLVLALAMMCGVALAETYNIGCSMSAESVPGKEYGYICTCSYKVVYEGGEVNVGDNGQVEASTPVTVELAPCDDHILDYVIFMNDSENSQSIEKVNDRQVRFNMPSCATELLVRFRVRQTRNIVYDCEKPVGDDPCACSIVVTDGNKVVYAALEGERLYMEATLCDAHKLVWMGYLRNNPPRDYVRITNVNGQYSFSMPKHDIVARAVFAQEIMIPLLEYVPSDSIIPTYQLTGYDINAAKAWTRTYEVVNRSNVPFNDIQVSVVCEVEGVPYAFNVEWVSVNGEPVSGNSVTLQGVDHYTKETERARFKIYPKVGWPAGEYLAQINVSIAGKNGRVQLNYNDGDKRNTSFTVIDHAKLETPSRVVYDKFADEGKGGVRIEIKFPSELDMASLEFASVELGKQSFSLSDDSLLTLLGNGYIDFGDLSNHGEGYQAHYLTLLDKYLQERSLGDLVLTCRMNQGNPLTVTIHIIDSSNASLNTTTANHDKNSYSEGVTVTLNPGAYALDAIMNGTTALVAGQDYTVSGDKYTFTKKYLDAQDLGDLTLTFKMAGGANPTLVIEIVDTTVICYHESTSTTTTWQSDERHLCEETCLDCNHVLRYTEPHVSNPHWHNGTVCSKCKTDANGVEHNWKDGVCTVCIEGVPAFNGLNPDDGWYYVDGEKSNVTGIYPYNTGLFYIKDGEWQQGANGLTLVGDTFWFLANGQVQEMHGFAEYDGEWFYLDGGKLDQTASGVFGYDGKMFLVAAGRLVAECTGLAQVPAGDWYYVAEGRVLTEYTGPAEWNGATFNIVNGKVTF